VGETRAGLGRMTGWAGMMEWAEMAMGLDKTLGWAWMVTGLAEMRVCAKMLMRLAKKRVQVL